MEKGVSLNLVNYLIRVEELIPPSPAIPPSESDRNRAPHLRRRRSHDAGANGAQRELLHADPHVQLQRLYIQRTVGARSHRLLRRRKAR
jgi:hypothetical protein